MVASVSDINSYVQTYSGSQLRTFDKTITYTVNTYVRYYRFDNTYGGALRLDGAQYTTNSTFTQRFEAGSATDAEFDGYYDAGVTAGGLMYAQDIVDTVEDAVRRAVDLMEERIVNTVKTINACHASCHSSCHTSRGRR